jgi:uncharacterized small protein (DUF1192 family)
MDRVTVAEAATRMGISQDAVRQRIRRNTIEHDKDKDGRVYVYIDATDTEYDTVHDDDHDSVQLELVAELRERIRLLETELDDRKEESRRKDHLLAAALERIPAIEAPASPEPSESPETPSEGTDKGCYSTARDGAALLVT